MIRSGVLAPILARLLRALATRSTPVRALRPYIAQGILCAPGPEREAQQGRARLIRQWASEQHGVVYQCAAVELRA